ncbi:eukaryotic translation elongation factor 1 epsilon-1-like [Lineus longissimus]|uniref:eukaryotic translation elongation factor 1 epsilon-1-like n=1 Tax=Lineus longissimus TaxID=88925 RepID=UPI002B4F0484
MAVQNPEFEALSQFLGVNLKKYKLKYNDKVPQISANKNSINGHGTVCKYLASASNKNLLGSSIEEEAAISQWIEYRLTQVDRSSKEQDVLVVLKELNDYLGDKVYLVGHRLSLADILLYYGMHSIMSNLTFYDKEKYMNLSRWFDQVQHIEGVRPHDLPLVVFQKSRLYTMDLS